MNDLVDWIFSLDLINHSLCNVCKRPLTAYYKGPFNNYVDKMRGGGCQKMSVFVHAQGIKTVLAGGGVQKMAKFCPRSC